VALSAKLCLYDPVLQILGQARAKDLQQISQATSKFAAQLERQKNNRDAFGSYEGVN